MWNKIYFISLAIAVLVMASLDFYSSSWLQSIGNPVNAVQNYEQFSGIAWLFLWISTLLLLVLANAMYWRTQLSWGLWATFLYFAGFVVVQTFLLDPSFASYKLSSGIGRDTFSVSPFFGVILCVVAAVIVFFDQYLVSRLHKKMYGVAPEEIEPVSEEI